MDEAGFVDHVRRQPNLYTTERRDNRYQVEGGVLSIDHRARVRDRVEPAFS